MKKVIGIFLATFFVFSIGTVMADKPAGPLVYLYVDAAPNVYGSPAYVPWQEEVFAAAANGTFVNMTSSINVCNVGTTNFEIEDEVVYSFGDLGKRLTWIYWIPGETVESLTGIFKISLLNTWDGELLDFYGSYYGDTWLEPTKWIDYDVDGDEVTDGVIGTAGMAWWGAYSTNAQPELDDDLEDWGTAQESWEFTADLDGNIFTIISKRRAVRVSKLFEGCMEGAKNNGAFVKCVAMETNELKKEGILTGQEKAEIQSCAGQSDIP